MEYYTDEYNQSSPYYPSNFSKYSSFSLQNLKSIPDKQHKVSKSNSLHEFLLNNAVDLDCVFLSNEKYYSYEIGKKLMDVSDYPSLFIDKFLYYLFQSLLQIKWLHSNGFTFGKEINESNIRVYDDQVKLIKHDKIEHLAKNTKSKIDDIYFCGIYFEELLRKYEKNINSSLENFKHLSIIEKMTKKKFKPKVKELISSESFSKFKSENAKTFFRKGQYSKLSSSSYCQQNIEVKDLFNPNRSLRLRRYINMPKLELAINLFSKLSKNCEHNLFEVDYFVENDFLYLVESSEGETLSNYLFEHKETNSYFNEWVKQLLMSVKILHNNNLFHQNLNIRNIIIVDGKLKLRFDENTELITDNEKINSKYRDVCLKNLIEKVYGSGLNQEDHLYETLDRHYFELYAKSEKKSETKKSFKNRMIEIFKRDNNKTKTKEYYEKPYKFDSLNYNQAINSSPSGNKYEMMKKYYDSPIIKFTNSTELESKNDESLMVKQSSSNLINDSNKALIRVEDSTKSLCSTNDKEFLFNSGFKYDILCLGLVFYELCSSKNLHQILLESKDYYIEFATPDKELNNIFQKMIDDDYRKRPIIQDLLELKFFSDYYTSVYIPFYEELNIDPECFFEYPDLKFKMHNGVDTKKIKYLFKIYEKDTIAASYYQNEKEIYNLLGISNQENIFKFIGHHKIQNNILIYQYRQFEVLSEKMKRIKASNETLEDDIKLKWCLQIASAINVLHNVCTHTIAHMEIKLKNMFICDEDLKLANFEKAKLNAQSSDLAYDIWSLGFALYSIFSDTTISTDDLVNQPAPVLNINENLKNINELYLWITNDNYNNRKPDSNDVLECIISAKKVFDEQNKFNKIIKDKKSDIYESPLFYLKTNQKPQRASSKSDYEYETYCESNRGVGISRTNIENIRKKKSKSLTESNNTTISKEKSERWYRNEHEKQKKTNDDQSVLKQNDELYGMYFNGRYKRILKLNNSENKVFYLAKDSQTNKEVLMKIIFTTDLVNSGIIEDFVLEELSKYEPHPNIINCLNTFIERNEYIFIHEYFKKGNLDKEIQKWKSDPNAFNNNLVLNWMIQIASAIDFLHTKTPKILHCNIKPQHLFITNEDTIKLGDFGMASLESHKLNNIRNYAYGSEPYMSPELIKEVEYDESVDIWAFACVIYECFMFKQLFPKGFSMEYYESEAKNDIKALKQFSNSNFDQFLLKMLSIKAEERPNSSFTYNKLKSLNNINNEMSLNKVENNGKRIFNESYEIIKSLGACISGEFYVMERLNCKTEKKVMKKLRFTIENDKHKLRSMLRELVILNRINMESIPLVEYFIENKNIYTIYPYYEQNLYDYIKENNEFITLNEKEIFKWTSGLVLALDYLELNSIKHKNLYPKNVFIQNKSLIIGYMGLLPDIELLNSQEELIDKEGFLYFPPELYEKDEITFSYDIWSLGCVLFEILTGDRLFMDYNEIKNKQIPKSLDKIESIFYQNLIKKMIKIAPIERIHIRKLVDAYNSLRENLKK